MYIRFILHFPLIEQLPESFGELNPTVICLHEQTPQEPLSYHPPSLLYPRHGESSYVISDEGPSGKPKKQSFTYPISPVYTALIYHKRQLYG